jgi:hypothetical protein
MIQNARREPGNLMEMDGTNYDRARNQASHT